MEVVLLKALSGLFNGLDGFCKDYYGHIFLAILAGLRIITNFTTKIAVKHAEYDLQIKDIEKDVADNKKDTKAATAAVARMETDVSCIKKDVTDIKEQIGISLETKFREEGTKNAG